ncbi:signal peptide peptidase SppA [Sphingomonas sp. ID0503]|uniref:signal peptide peptidase SppA n=1 Tax=Sphingomonas sp. ID0503 TaxID=3399691 RepID=UPI003AFA67D5
MKILKWTWKILRGVKDALVLLLLLLFFGALYAALSFRPAPISIREGALVLDLDGPIVEQPAEVPPTAILTNDTSAREYRLRDILRSLAAAAGDSRVKAVALDLDQFGGGGHAALGEVGAALDKVRASGKPVLAFASGYTDDGYQLAAHASEVWLDPIGAVLVTGPGGTQLYYKGLLDKLGVTAHVYRVGKFKSAVEPFTRSDQSPEARAAAQALADTIWTNWQADVARARPKAQVATYVAAPADRVAASGGDMAKAAQAAGLIDRIGDRLAFNARLAELAGGANDGVTPYRQIRFDDYARAVPQPAGAPIGVLTIAGEIVDGSAPPGTAGGDDIADNLLRALADGKMKALVVRVDSPGGSVNASERIRSAIVKVKASGLPVVVSMGSVAASGGYWVSTPADRIFAEPSTITGSIGVFGIIPTFEGSLAKLGLGADGVRTTPYSGQPDVLRGTTPEVDRLVQAGVDNYYARFLGLVARSRNMTLAAVHEIAQGRVWAGIDAKRLGLIDEYGGLDAAVTAAARLAKVDPQHARPVLIEKAPSIWAQLFKDYRDRERRGDARVDVFTRLAARPQALIAQALAEAEKLSTGAAIQARCLECGTAAARPVRPENSWLATLARTALQIR